MCLRESARDNLSDVNYCGHTRTRPSVALPQVILDSLRTDQHTWGVVIPRVAKDK